MNGFHLPKTVSICTHIELQPEDNIVNLGQKRGWNFLFFFASTFNGSFPQLFDSPCGFCKEDNSAQTLSVIISLYLAKKLFFLKLNLKLWGINICSWNNMV